MSIYRLIAYFVAAALLFPGPQVVVVAAVLTGHLVGALMLTILWVGALDMLIAVSTKTQQRTGGSVDSPIVTSEHLLVVKSSPGKPQEIREARTRKLH